MLTRIFRIGIGYRGVGISLIPAARCCQLQPAPSQRPLRDAARLCYAARPCSGIPALGVSGKDRRHVDGLLALAVDLILLGGRCDEFAAVSLARVIDLPPTARRALRKQSRIDPRPKRHAHARASACPQAPAEAGADGARRCRGRGRRTHLPPGLRTLTGPVHGVPVLLRPHQQNPGRRRGFLDHRNPLSPPAAPVRPAGGQTPDRPSLCHRAHKYTRHREAIAKGQRRQRRTLAPTLSSDVSNRSELTEKAIMNASTFMKLALLIASNASCPAVSRRVTLHACSP